MFNKYINIMKHIFLIILCLLFAVISSYAKLADSEFMDMSLEELLDVQVSVASGSKSLTTRESPGIVTLITNDQIVNSGARDLIDVLRMVPGFSFGVDQLNVVGIAIRGIWAHEGKVLLQIDGIDMNEELFATTQFGKHYPVELIDRIEIIRGPGSAIYGGYAELGVINIITKKPEELVEHEFTITGKYGQMSEVMDNASGNIYYGRKTEDYKVYLSGMIQSGNRSDREYADFYGGSFLMGEDDNSQLNTLFLNAGFEYLGFDARVVIDRHTIYSRDIFDESLPSDLETIHGDYFTYAASLKYDLNLMEGLTITPRLEYKQQQPWHYIGEEARAVDEYGISISTDDIVTKVSGDLIISWDINENINVTGGTEYWNIVYDDKFYATGYSNEFRDFEISNIAVFAQALFKTEIANFTIGARLDDHSEADPAFVPRAAITKVFGDFHVKLLAAKSFRGPAISNITNYMDTEGIDTQVKPENTTVYEFEAGLKLLDKLLITGNLFHITIEDPIVYYFDGDDRYDNFDKTGTYGFEFAAKWQDTWGFVNADVSFYQVTENAVDQYDVVVNGEKNENVLLGAPQIKMNLNSSIKITKNLRINPSITFIGERYGYNFFDEEEEDISITESFDPITLFNLNLVYRNLFVEGFELSIGATNLLDEEMLFIQPYYDGFHNVFPDASRSINVRISYNFNTNRGNQ